MGDSKTYDDEPTALYESTTQTPWRRDHSAEIEEAYRQRFLDETDGRDFGPPDEEPSATACHRCGREPEAGSGAQYENTYGYRRLCCDCFEDVCAEQIAAEAEADRQDDLRLLVEERDALRLRLAELDEAIAAMQGEAPPASSLPLEAGSTISFRTLRLENGATIEFSGPDGPPLVGSEHALLVQVAEEGATD